MTTSRCIAPVLLALSMMGGACQHSYDTASPDEEAPAGEQPAVVIPALDVLQVAADEYAAGRAQAEAESAAEIAPLASEADRAFVRATVLDSEIELALAASATKYAQRDDVKALALLVTDDHTVAVAELKALAEANNIPLPADRSDRVARTVANVEQWVGRRFDRIYLETMLAEHITAVEAFRRASEHGTQPELRSWAATRLPIIEDHLQHTQKILAELPSDPVAHR